MGGDRGCGMGGGGRGCGSGGWWQRLRAGRLGL